MRGTRQLVSHAKRRRPLAALLDQAVVALASAGTALLGIMLLEPSQAGAMMYSLAFLYFVQGIARSLIGQTMLAYLPRVPPERHSQELANAHAAALVLACVAGAGLFVVWRLLPVASINELAWCAAVTPTILLLDACRFSHLTFAQQSRALGLDCIALGGQIVVVVMMLMLSQPSGGTLIASWGFGAGVGVVAFYRHSAVRTFRGKPVAWVRSTGHLLGWLTACAVLGQLQALAAANIITGLLDKSSWAALRFTQILILQPVGNLSIALNGLLVPVSAIEAAQSTTMLIRSTRNRVLATAALGGALLLLSMFLVRPFLESYREGDYALAAALVLPVGLQAWVYLIQVPFGIALLALHRADLMFFVYVAYLVCSVGGILVGVLAGGMREIAFGMATASVIALVVEVTMFVHAARHRQLTEVTRAD